MNFGSVTSARVISSRRRSPPESAYAQLVEQGLEPPFPLLAVDRERLEDREDVLLDGEFAEDRRLLRQVADAAPRALIHRHPRDVGPVEPDRAGRGRDEARDHVERGRLAGAVGAEQADDLALAQLERDVVHHVALAVRLHEPVRREDASRPHRPLGEGRCAARLHRMLAGEPEERLHAGRIGGVRAAHRRGEPDLQLAVGPTEVDRLERPGRHQARERHAAQVIAHLIQRKASRLHLHVASLGAHRVEMVVAVRDRHVVERREPLGVRALADREETERRRAVPAGEAQDELAVRAVGGWGLGHGFLGSGFAVGGRVVSAAERVGGAIGSRKIPEARSRTSTFETSPSLKETIISRPRL
jgi:hypothetical protein